MDVKENLIGLINEANCKWHNEFASGGIVEFIAGYLISKGVTIPVRCEECKYCEVVNQYPVYAKCNKIGHMFALWREDTRKNFCSYGERREK